jgi:aldose 1-epimerase
VRLRTRSVLAAVATLDLLTAAACTPRDPNVRDDAPDSAAPSGATTPRAAGAGVTRAPFGTLPDGQAVELFTFANANGTEVRATNYGGIITALRTKDRDGRLDDIVLGYDSLAGYLKESPYFGAIVGRVANRVARGTFTLDGKRYTLATNNGPNSLHGGLKGFDKVVWAAEPFQTDSGSGVALRYVSKAGEEGYPGTLTVGVRYTLTPRDELVVDYEATTDAATPVTLSQHTYWNLAGTGAPANGAAGTPLPTNAQHLLTLDASSYTPVDSTLIPTGEVVPVAGTPFDFRTPTAIGARIDAAHEQLKFGGGYDHNWVLDRNGRTGLVHAARVAEPTTGRTLDIATTEPGIQFYAGNFLDGKITGKAGRTYPYRSAIALETQHFPDSPNHPNFPSVILRPGETYRSRTVFTFGTTR